MAKLRPPDPPRPRAGGRMPVLVALVTGLAVGSVVTALLIAPKTGPVLGVATDLDVGGDSTGSTGAEPERPARKDEPDGPDEPPKTNHTDPPSPASAEAPPEPEPETVETAVAPPKPSTIRANPPLRFEDVEIDHIVGTRPWVVHRILRVESLEQVAYRYDATPQSVRNWNGLGPEAEPPAGLRVKLKARRVPPTRKRVKHTVQPGDTWWSIGVAHGIDSRDLRAANWNAPSRLSGGETLTLWIDPVVYHWIHDDGALLAGGGPDTDTDTAEDLASSIRRGAVGVGSPWDGRLINGVLIPKGAGWRRKMMPSSYGTTHAVASLVTALQEFHANSGYERDVLLGSMSWLHGGPMKGHRSHRTGRDLDIRLPLLVRYPSWSDIEPRRVDFQALWKLVAALLDTGEVEMLFLDHELQRRLHKAATKLGVDRATLRHVIQWPRGPNAHAGLMRHEDGHREHCHVRFRCGPYETECAAGSAAGRDGG